MYLQLYAHQTDATVFVDIIMKPNEVWNIFQKLNVAFLIRQEDILSAF